MERKEYQTQIKSLLTRRGRKRIINEEQFLAPTLDDIDKVRRIMRHILVTHDDPTGELPKAVGILEAKLENEISPATQRQKQEDKDILKQKNRRETLEIVGLISIFAAGIGVAGWGIKELFESETRRRIDYELTHTLNLNPSQPSRSGWRIRHLLTEDGVTYVENPDAGKIPLEPNQHIFFTGSDNTFIYLEGYKSSNNEVLAKLVVEGLGRNQEWIIDTKPIKGINNQVIAFDDVKTGKSTWFSVKVMKGRNSDGYLYTKSFELIPVKRISQ